MSNNALENSDIFKVRIGKIKGIKVCNFKSFENDRFVGPFSKFTSIIGPNGGDIQNIQRQQENQMFQINLICFGNFNKVNEKSQRAEKLIYSFSVYYKNYREKDYVEIIFDAINYIKTQISLKGVQINSSKLKFLLKINKELKQSQAHFSYAKNFIMLLGDTDTLKQKNNRIVQYKNICQQIQAELHKRVIRMMELQFQRESMRIEQKKSQIIKKHFWQLQKKLMMKQIT